MSQIVAASALTGLGACASSPDDRVARLEALLARHDSATLALEDWCRSQGIADPTVVAYPVDRGAIEEPYGLRNQLQVSAGETVRVRHVRLACGEITLSRASNWYVPARLTPAMNDTLDNGTTPFGKVAAPLGFHRETIESHRAGGPQCPAGTQLFQRALLRLPDGQPLALVTECYLLGA
jgi:chorismate-pyruvate lyase